MKYLNIYFSNRNHKIKFQGFLDEDILTVFVDDENCDFYKLLQLFYSNWINVTDQGGNQYFIKIFSYLKSGTPYSKIRELTFRVNFIISISFLENKYKDLETFVSNITRISFTDEIISEFYSNDLKLDNDENSITISNFNNTSEKFKFNLKNDQEIIGYFYSTIFPSFNYNNNSLKINQNSYITLEFFNQIKIEDIITLKYIFVNFLRLITNQNDICIEKFELYNQKEYIGEIKFFPYIRNQFNYCFKYSSLNDYLDNIFERISSFNVYLMQLPIKSNKKLNVPSSETLIYASFFEWLFDNLDCEIIRGKKYKDKEKARIKIKETLMELEGNRVFRDLREKLIQTLETPTLEVKMKSLFSKYNTLIQKINDLVFRRNTDYFKLRENAILKNTPEDCIERFISLRNKAAHGGLNYPINKDDSLVLDFINLSSYALLFKLFNVSDQKIWESIQYFI